MPIATQTTGAVPSRTTLPRHLPPRPAFEPGRYAGEDRRTPSDAEYTGIERRRSAGRRQAIRRKRAVRIINATMATIACIGFTACLALA